MAFRRLRNALYTLRAVAKTAPPSPWERALRDAWIDPGRLELDGGRFWLAGSGLAAVEVWREPKTDSPDRGAWEALQGMDPHIPAAPNRPAVHYCAYSGLLPGHATSCDFGDVRVRIEGLAEIPALDTAIAIAPIPRGVLLFCEYMEPKARRGRRRRPSGHADWRMIQAARYHRFAGAADAYRAVLREASK